MVKVSSYSALKSVLRPNEVAFEKLEPLSPFRFINEERRALLLSFELSTPE